MFDPGTTYRIQFHKDFTFQSLEEIIPYLHKLGVSAIYASPIFEAVPGSNHGYDGVNPNRINPEIGTIEQLRQISKKLKNLNINWIQDIVPNHMAFHSHNAWLMDVLEKGEASPFAPYFDIEWRKDGKQERLMCPFLGDILGDVIDKGELTIIYSDGKFAFKYFDSFFPLKYGSYAAIINYGNNEKIKDTLLQLLDKSDTETLQIELKDNHVKTYIDKCLEITNSDKVLLKNIADEQHYRLCHWQETNVQINYRRFFTINGLICLNIQSEDVFSNYHTLIKSLVDENIFQGLRIDHIDGLYNPTQYLFDLRKLTNEDIYITVEKILGIKEETPSYWTVQGTTGYDFLAMVNNVFTNTKNKRKFTTLYKTFANNPNNVHQQFYDKKAYILYAYMNGELDNLYNLFKELDLVEESVLAAIPSDIFKKAIGLFLVYCPVYRYYGDKMPLSTEEKNAIQQIFNEIKEKNETLDAAVSILEKTLLSDKDSNKNDVIRFYQRCMQFTSPLAAKGVEDTLMYTYNLFIAHNDVGDSPELFGISISEFHSMMQDRQRKWPYTMNTTSTHDTKRGEDVRARLNVLSDIADKWEEAVKRWRGYNSEIKKSISLDANDEYFIYQTLIGTYPMQQQLDNDIVPRLQAYMIKAVREAKIHSDWQQPDSNYENDVKTFINALSDTGRPFWNDFKMFHGQMVDQGIINSLSQLLLKFTCPGIPDTYQGCDLWDLSMVDPDNRRPVDYELREQWLNEIKSRKSNTELISELWRERYNGRIKLWLINKLLEQRRDSNSFFVKADYIPLKVEGTYKNNILAFARYYDDDWYIVALPLHMATLQKDNENSINIDWKDTSIVLPEYAPSEWKDLFTTNILSGQNKIRIDDFRNFPFILLKNINVKSNRKAGILFPVFSIASPYGIGDFGPDAKDFVDSLHRSRQKVWQILPLNPTEAKAEHSPYSSTCSMASNPLFISPRLLAEAGLLDRDKLKEYQLPLNDKVDYTTAEKTKKEIFDTAYNAFITGDFISLKYSFEVFCKQQAHWLNDYAAYTVLKNKFNDIPWFQWPEKYKKHDAEFLKELKNTEAQSIHKIKWLQFIADKQWKELKEYCNKSGIEIFGDLPFYISYDSSDVWANPDMFCLDENGNMEGIAGVPPDYFSETGQLWNMPTYNWNNLKENNYEWWMARLKKNLEMFDIVRIDHFRAFDEYWQVPAGEEIAVHGEWIKGPGIDFFNIAKERFGVLPIVAEDLGDNMEKVYELRNAVNLPGMKVLQFAWGENMPYSVDIPHNYLVNCVAYTGTHDNNTTIGWYKEETKKADHERMRQYLDIGVNRKNINDVLNRVLYATVANMVILPIQDVLGLGKETRFNTPGTSENNWLWRFPENSLPSRVEKQLKSWVTMYNR